MAALSIEESHLLHQYILFQHGVITPSMGHGVPLSKTFLPQRLKALGYDTHAVGK